MSPTNEELRERRKAIGARLEDVAREAGVSISTVCFWENGTREPHRIMRTAWLHAIERLEERANAIPPEAA